MKKLLKYCLFLFILFSLVACSQVVSDNSSFENGTESISFSFRAGETIEGSELTVSLTSSNGKTIASQKQFIKDSGNITFNFDGLPAGEKITITAVIVKNNIELYKGSESIIVKNGNNPIKLDVEAANIYMNLVTDSSLPYGQLDGTILDVSVNGKVIKSVEIKRADTSISIDAGYFPVGSKMNVEATITRPDSSVGSDIDGSELLYICSQVHEVKSGANTITFDLNEFKGYFLWSTSESMPNLKVKYDVVKNKNLKDYDFNREPSVTRPSQGFSSGLLDYCIDDNGYAWTLFYAGDGVKVVKCSYYIPEDTTPKKTAQISKMDGKAISMLNGKILVVGEQTASPDSSPQQLNIVFNFLSIAPDGSQDIKADLNLPTVSYTPGNVLGKETIRAMAVSGNDVYVAINSIVEHPDQVEPEVIIKIVKFNYDVAGNSFNQVSENKLLAANTRCPSGFVTDMQVDDKYLYVTVIDSSMAKAGGSVSKGTLLKIDTSTLDVVNKLSLVPDDFCRSDGDAQKYLIGPRKFVAIKPKKLVIADAGAIRPSDDEYAQLRKRVVTVDLEKFAIEKIETLGENMFEGCISSSVSGAYDLQLSN